MPTNINLANIANMLPANGYKPSGGVGGIQAGIQLADYLDSMDRGRRMDDIDYQTAQNDLANKLKDNPLLDAKRQLDLSKTGLEQSSFDSGKQRELMDTSIEQKLSDLRGKIDNETVAALGRQSEVAFNLQKELENGDMTQERYSGYVDRLGKLGVKLNPQLGDPQSMQLIARIAKAAPQTIKFAQEQLIQGQREEGQQTLEHIRGGYHVQSARITADAQRDKASNTIDTKDQDQLTQNQIRAKKIIGTDDILAFAGALNDDIKKSLDSEDYKNSSAGWETDWNRKPELRKYFEDKGGHNAYLEIMNKEWIVTKKADIMTEKLAGKPLFDDQGNKVTSIGPNSKKIIIDVLLGKPVSSKQPLSSNAQVPQDKTSSPSALNQDQQALVSKFGTDYDAMEKYAMSQPQSARRDAALAWIRSQKPIGTFDQSTMPPIM